MKSNVSKNRPTLVYYSNFACYLHCISVCSVLLFPFVTRDNAVFGWFCVALIQSEDNDMNINLQFQLFSLCLLDMIGLCSTW